jgi:hypothetical protein
VPADYPEVGPQCSQCLTSFITYKDPLLDIIFEQNLLDLLIFYKSRMGICFYNGPRLDIIAKESMLDWAAYQEVKLDTKMVTSHGRDMLLTLLRFFPSTWVPQPLLYLP